MTAPRRACSAARARRGAAADALVLFLELAAEELELLADRRVLLRVRRDWGGAEAGGEGRVKAVIKRARRAGANA